MIVARGDTLDYEATLKNKMLNRYTNGLLNTDVPDDLVSAVPPTTFILHPTEKKTIDGTITVEADATSTTNATLTRGGATRQRHRYGLSVQEMGEVRLAEMRKVTRVLDLPDLTVLDLPDGGLKEMDPREVEKVVLEHLQKIQPEEVATYAVHGISGFHDHLVCHAVVKRVFCEARESIPALRRLALVTITE